MSLLSFIHLQEDEEEDSEVEREFVADFEESDEDEIDIEVCGNAMAQCVIHVFLMFRILNVISIILVVTQLILIWYLEMVCWKIRHWQR